MEAENSGAFEGQMDASRLPLFDDSPERRIIGDELLQAYNFGDGVTVVGADAWNSDDRTDLVKVVYVEYDDDGVA